MKHPTPALLPTTSPTRTAQSYRPTRPLLTRAGDAIGSGSAAAEHGDGSWVGRPLPSAGLLTLCCPSALIVAAPIRAASATATTIVAQPGASTHRQRSGGRQQFFGGGEPVQRPIEMVAIALLRSSAGGRPRPIPPLVTWSARTPWEPENDLTVASTSLS